MAAQPSTADIALHGASSALQEHSHRQGNAYRVTGNAYITVIIFLELISALHYILFTANIFGWNNFALQDIILTTALKLHLLLFHYITLKILEAN